jgi:hypothetical protein
MFYTRTSPHTAILSFGLYTAALYGVCARCISKTSNSLPAKFAKNRNILHQLQRSHLLDDRGTFFFSSNRRFFIPKIMFKPDENVPMTLYRRPF